MNKTNINLRFQLFIIFAFSVSMHLLAAPRDIDEPHMSPGLSFLILVLLFGSIFICAWNESKENKNKRGGGIDLKALHDSEKEQTTESYQSHKTETKNRSHFTSCEIDESAYTNPYFIKYVTRKQDNSTIRTSDETKLVVDKQTPTQKPIAKKNEHCPKGRLRDRFFPVCGLNLSSTNYDTAKAKGYSIKKLVYGKSRHYYIEGENFVGNFSSKRLYSMKFTFKATDSFPSEWRGLKVKRDSTQKQWKDFFSYWGYEIKTDPIHPTYFEASSKDESLSVSLSFIDDKIHEISFLDFVI